MTKWQNKVVLVTGGATGLGRAIAEAFAAAGAQVVIASRDAEKLTAAANKMSRGGQDVVAIPADVTRQTDVDRLFDQVIAQCGRLDVLVNNAGKSSRGRAIETTPEQFLELLDLNFLSVVRCTRAAAPHLLASHGHIVNIGSLAAKTASKFLGAYPASKFPVAAYSQQLRYELGPDGVHVLLVCPGPIAREDAGQRYNEQSKNLPAEARRPGGGAKIKGLDPHQLAAQIIRACERRQPELVVPGITRLLFAISQLWPALGDRILKRYTS